MEPFIFRRLKADVLKELPEKNHDTVVCEMTPYQEKEYFNLLDFYKKRKFEILAQNEAGAHAKLDGIFGVLMELRKAANHPLLRRCFYDDEKIKDMAHIILKVLLFCYLFCLEIISHCFSKLNCLAIRLEHSIRLCD